MEVMELKCVMVLESREELRSLFYQMAACIFGSETKRIENAGYIKEIILDPLIKTAEYYKDLELTSSICIAEIGIMNAAISKSFFKRVIIYIRTIKKFKKSIKVKRP